MRPVSLTDWQLPNTVPRVLNQYQSTCFKIRKTFSNNSRELFTNPFRPLIRQPQVVVCRADASGGC